jgi:hypothetical protein
MVAVATLGSGRGGTEIRLLSLGVSLLLYPFGGVGGVHEACSFCEIL